MEYQVDERCLVDCWRQCFSLSVKEATVLLVVMSLYSYLRRCSRRRVMCTAYRVISGSERMCVCGGWGGWVYVYTLKQKTLDILSPNLAGG